VENIKGGTPGPAKLAVVKWQPHFWENIFRSEWWDGMKRVRKIQCDER